MLGAKTGTQLMKMDKPNEKKTLYGLLNKLISEKELMSQKFTRI